MVHWCILIIELYVLTYIFSILSVWINWIMYSVSHTIQRVPLFVF